MLTGFISVKQIIFFRKVSEENKRNMIEGLNNLKTVGESNRIFRESQYKLELEARNIYQMAGASTLGNLKMMTRQNIIQNLPVTVEDIEIEQKIFGPEVYTLKLRTTIQRPKVVVDDFIGMPR